jgi:ribosomal protein S24E
MGLKITEKKQNKLFSRIEIEGNISAESVPSRDEIMKVFASGLKTDVEKIVVKSIKGNFGSKINDGKIFKEIFEHLNSKEFKYGKKSKISQKGKKTA